MNVEVIEMGERPSVLTRSRQNAPAGARVLGEMLGLQGFADSAMVMLDWTNELRAQPDEVAKPVLVVRVQKKLPQYERRNVLTVGVRLDVDDLFGNDTITAEDILEIIKELAVTVDRKVEERKREP